MLRSRKAPTYSSIIERKNPIEKVPDLDKAALAAILASKLELALHSCKVEPLSLPSGGLAGRGPVLAHSE